MAESYVDSFLKTLQAVKGTESLLSLTLHHWSPPTPELRSAIRGCSRALGNPGAMGAPVPPEELILQPDGALNIGDYVELEGKIPQDGYLTLFNFGTSGNCTKLFPAKRYPDNYFHAGDKFFLPSERILSRAVFPSGEWKELGPATAETGLCERVLAILTHDKINLELSDLHARLGKGGTQSGCLKSCGTQPTATQSRGAGFGGQVVVETPKLFNLSNNSWDYGLVSIKVVP